MQDETIWTMDEGTYARYRLLANPTLGNMIGFATALLRKTMRSPGMEVGISCKYIGRESAAALRGEDVRDCVALVSAVAFDVEKEDTEAMMVVLCKVREENPEETNAELARHMRAEQSRFGTAMSLGSVRIFDFGRGNYELRGVPTQIIPDISLEEATCL